MALTPAQMVNQANNGSPVVWRGHILSAAGGGALDPAAPLVLGDDPTTMGIGSVTGVRLVVVGAPTDTNDQNATMVVGCSDPAFDLDGLDAYSGDNAALYGKSVSGVGLRAQSASGRGVYATTTGSGAALYGVSTSGPGVDASTTSGPALIAHGATLFAADLQGYVRLANVTAPAAPAAGYVLLYLDAADDIVKVKTSDGTVHPLW
jgi:hypothetical protein